ncbi:MAG TPA: NAD(P)H-dependent oxidoreductase subunit E [Dehalococcoidales bacterium]
MTTRIKTIEESLRGPVTAEEITDLERILQESRARGDSVGNSNLLFCDIRQSIEQRYGQAGAIIRVLQHAQNRIGYLPTPVIKLIAREMRVPLSEVYGIISFYHFFSLHPKGKYVIQVCMGTSCYVKGGQAILDTLRKEMHLLPDEITEDGLYSLETVRCLGACGISPVVSAGTEIHGRVKASKIMEILESYR